MSFLVKMCECFEVKPLETVVIGTIPYIQPATRKEYFVIAERDNNKILWALDIDTESDNVKQIDKNDVIMFHAMPMTKKGSFEKVWEKHRLYRNKEREGRSYNIEDKM